MKIKVILILTYVLSCTAFASSNFKCTIKDAVYLENDGFLNHESNVVIRYIGKEFTVNRSNGVITGANLNNTMSGQMPIVYDYLPEENGFKAVTHYKPNNTVDYLQINQYVEGSEKPFFFREAFGIMVSGLCIKY